MFELMVGTSIISLLITIGGMTLALFLLRLVEVITRRINAIDALIILFVPFSIGYFLRVPSNGFVKKIYRGLIILLFVLLLLGSFFIFYMQK